jgi:hypothetical protein
MDPTASGPGSNEMPATIPRGRCIKTSICVQMWKKAKSHPEQLQVLL